MGARRSLTASQKASLRYLLHGDPQTFKRSRTAGERVTLASLWSRGYAERRAWRGDGVSRDSAFEYRPTVGIALAYAQARAGSHGQLDELDAHRASRAA